MIVLFVCPECSGNDFKADPKTPQCHGKDKCNIGGVVYGMCFTCGWKERE
jgi:hypothetical protein